MAAEMQPAPSKTVPEVSSRDRLIAAAKHQFSAGGYENTTTVAIAREARTSESQLVKHFGSKEGLLESIFEAGWSKLRMDMAVLQNIASPRKRLKALMHMVIQLFTADPQLRDVMLLEGRRIRREGKMIMLTRSYTELVSYIDSVIQSAGSERAQEFPPQLIRSSLMGMFEALLRDMVLHERFGYPAGYSSAQVEKFVSTLVDRLLSA